MEDQVVPIIGLESVPLENLQIGRPLRNRIMYDFQIPHGIRHMMRL